MNTYQKKILQKIKDAKKGLLISRHRRDGKSKQKIFMSWDLGSKNKTEAIIFDEEGKILEKLPNAIIKSGEFFTYSTGETKNEKHNLENSSDICTDQRNDICDEQSAGHNGMG